jgi:tetratricopeptide (TPR) repeat protein
MIQTRAQEVSIMTPLELQNKALRLYKQMNYEESARLFHQAHEAYLNEGDALMAAEMQVNVGLAHRALGNFQMALDYMEEALREFQARSDPLRIAKTIGNIGGVFNELNDKEQAYYCYRQAVEMFQEMGENEHHGETLLAIARLQIRDGKLLRGASTYEAGLQHLTHLTSSQKVLRRLLSFRNMLTSGQ